MTDIVDHDGILLFVDDFTHTIHCASETPIYTLTINESALESQDYAGAANSLL
ncbi:hypothetical protein SuNHUV7_04910 (plasmid) [Pseudoseohaeicola sp. NH-UV-7]|uniref:hypothetical protein n=1 Tax=Sulfitobacter sp. TBRI5 TaxID=2989732 RepID=UPI003A772CF1